MKDRKHVRFYQLLAFATVILIISFSNFSSKSSKGSVVEHNGQLSIRGIYTVNQVGTPVELKGMSLFWSQWEGEFYNEDCIKWLRDDWKCDVVRAALGIETDSGYLNFPSIELAKIEKVIEAGIKHGLYVIIDWHSHYAEKSTSEAIEFFGYIAEKYGGYPNIIYEIYNEPLKISWDSDIKPYADAVIAEIRRFDPDNIIIVGTPRWSQDVDVVAQNPIDGANIAYAFHFYAATHKQEFRDKCQVAIDSGLALWASEFGTCYSDGDGAIDYEELSKWMDFMKKNKISWCNWSVADKKETSAILKPNADPKGRWPDDMITESGLLIKRILTQEKE